MATASPARRDATEALLDAAESLLVEVGYAAITVRKLADRAGVNHGLVHYYFGSMEEVFLQTLERFTNRLIERQTGCTRPRCRSWRSGARRWPTSRPTSTAATRRCGSSCRRWPGTTRRCGTGWRRCSAGGTTCCDRPSRSGSTSSGVDKERFPPDAVVTLVTTFNQGVMLEHLSGVTTGHDELLAMIDGWLTEREDAASTDDGGGTCGHGNLIGTASPSATGVKLAYEVFGDEAGRPTVLLLPTWQIVHSRHWKAQVPYLARHFRVVTFDGRGTGRSSRPVGAASYTDLECAADVVAVLDATGTDRAVLVALSCGSTWAVHAAADHPERVSGIVALAPSCGLDVAQPHRESYAWDGVLDTTEGWAKYNRRYWLEGDYDDFVRFFFGRMFSEPHSTKQIEDTSGWGHEIEPATLADTTAGRLGCDGVVCASVEEACGRVTLPGARGPRRRRPHPHRRGRQAAGRADRRLVRLAGRQRARSARPPSGARQRADPRRSSRPCTRRRPHGHDLDRRHRPSPTGVVPARPPSASVTPGATSPSPARCAPTTPTCRSTGWRRNR